MLTQHQTQERPQDLPGRTHRPLPEGSRSCGPVGSGEAQRRAAATRAETGDRDLLYARLQPAIKRMILKYGTTPDIRQELVGEIYQRFCQHLPLYEPDRGVPLEGYLLRVLSAAAYTYARSQWVRQQREVRMDVESAGGWLGGSCDPTPEWNESLALGDVSETFRSAIRRLPQRQRQALILRFYEDQSHGEIAERLNTCPATARSILRHALNNLRRNVPRSAVLSGEVPS